MNLISFLHNKFSSSITVLFFMATVSGLSSAALLALVTTTAGDFPPDIQQRIGLIIIFTLLFSLFIYAKRYTLVNSSKIMEETIHKFRIKIVDKIRSCDLLFIEDYNKSHFFSLLTQEANIISQSINSIVNACESGIMIFFCLIYIAILSKTAFIIALIGIIAGYLLIVIAQRNTKELIESSMAKETLFFSTLRDILNGFKENKLNREKQTACMNDFTQITQDVKVLNKKVTIFFTENFMFLVFLMYFIIGTIVFLLPLISPKEEENIIQLAMVFLYIVMPLMAAVSTLPKISKANIAAGKLLKLDEYLTEKTLFPEKSTMIYKDFSQFSTIVMQGVLFRYPNEDDSFELGPLDIQIKNNEILFLVGGNGSGKTTLLKLISGLYHPVEGNILVDGIPLKKKLHPSYRELFGGVFSDYHLFNHLYGLEHIDAEQVNNLLEKMGLSEKTNYANGQFTETSLSRGQRKRLGLIVSLLEEKPIYIFDEWTADQDPKFRQEFYEEILPELKSRGKTIIVISHDDRYFSVADRVICLEYGAISR